VAFIGTLLQALFLSRSFITFPECVAKGSRFALGSLDTAFVFATVGNRLQPFAMIELWPCLWRLVQKWSHFEVSNVA
jgi:hypothetical protein